MSLTVDERQAAYAQSDIETRNGAGQQVAEVNFPKRIVTVVAMPYESPAVVDYRGKSVTEIVSRSAFDGVEKRTGMIKAFRDHHYQGVVGKIVGLHPSRSEGLVSEVKIFPTPLGEETLTLCDEGGLDASVGFGLLKQPDGRVYPDAEVWDRSRSVRRLNRLFLDHLALVPDPAYPGAVVLDVRTAAGRTQDPPDGLAAAGVTPNLDRLALDALRAQMAALDERWPH